MEMDEEKAFGGVGIFLIIALIWAWSTIHSQNQKIDELKSTIETCSDRINEANGNINDLNNQIEDAAGQAWTDYDSMGSTLEGLETGDTVTNDCYDDTANN